MKIWPLLLLAVSGYAQALGTWKMNPEKSRYSTGPFPKALTVKFEPHPDGEIFTMYIAGADGAAQTVSHILYFDGKERVAEPDAFETETLLSRKLGAGTVEIVRKRNGKLFSRCLRTLSPDGKQMTLEFIQVVDKGPNLERKLVLEKTSKKERNER
jgi:hypothetical protein